MEVYAALRALAIFLAHFFQPPAGARLFAFLRGFPEVRFRFVARFLFDVRFRFVARRFFVADARRFFALAFVFFRFFRGGLRRAGLSSTLASILPSLLTLISLT